MNIVFLSPSPAEAFNKDDILCGRGVWGEGCVERRLCLYQFCKIPNEINSTNDTEFRFDKYPYIKSERALSKLFQGFFFGGI